jgi:hypothetical protein
MDADTRIECDTRIHLILARIRYWCGFKIGEPNEALAVDPAETNPTLFYSMRSSLLLSSSFMGTAARFFRRLIRREQKEIQHL